MALVRVKERREASVLRSEIEECCLASGKSKVEPR